MFCQNFSRLLKSASNFEHFEKKDEPNSWCIYGIIDCKKRGYLNAQNTRRVMDIQHVKISETQLKSSRH